MARTEKTVATIGVHGWTFDTFLSALRDAGVSTVLDVRQRRGVRGSEYAWANSRRLEAAIAEAGIGYRHVPELAPTTELRELQYREDARRGVGKRSRLELAGEYVRRYELEILAQVGVATLLADLPAALLCVEREPEACHRSLIAARLGGEHGAGVVHLRPG